MKTPIYVCSIVVLLTLAGCQRNHAFQDLQDYLLKVDQEAVIKKAPPKTLPMTQLKPVTYHKESSRTPFEETNKPRAGTIVTSNNPLNRYPLNILRFVGVLTQNEETWGYIQTPDGKLYQVAIGDMIGDRNGKIVKISLNKLEVVEPTIDEEKQNTQRIVTLQLKEEADNEQTE
jgi:Tfp pilus assembly protein PilP